MRSVKDVLTAYRNLIALTEKGIFRLPLEGESEGEEASSRGGGRSSSSFNSSAPRRTSEGTKKD